MRSLGAPRCGATPRSPPLSPPSPPEGATASSCQVAALALRRQAGSGSHTLPPYHFTTLRRCHCVTVCRAKTPAMAQPEPYECMFAACDPPEDAAELASYRERNPFVTYLPCKACLAARDSVYCKECLNVWIEKNEANCPRCRKPVRAEDARASGCPQPVAEIRPTPPPTPQPPPVTR